MMISILCDQLIIKDNMMRLITILTLVTCVALLSFKNINLTKTISVAGLHSTKQGGNQNSPCLMNLGAGLTKCDTSNSMQEGMVLIRGQLLPVERNYHGS